MHTPAPNEVPTPERLTQLIWGYAPMLVLEVAVELRVFDRLEAGPKTLDALAAETGCAARGLRGLLHALAGLKFLSVADSGYALTPESAAFLVSTKPGYRGLFLRHHRDQLLPQWLQLADAVRTGRPVARTNRQQEGGAYFAAFVESLYAANQAAAVALGRALEIAQRPGPTRVLDVGAGSGVWGIELARQSSQVRVCAVDWPEVLEVTRRVATREGVGERFTQVAGDFVEADLGRDHHVATLGHVLHSEGVPRVQRLLRRVGEALVPGGVIAIQEFVPDDDRRGPAFPLLFALNMLVNTEAGDTYTYAELRTWLEAAGFIKVRRLEVPAPSPLVLAEKPAARGAATGGTTP